MNLLQKTIPIFFSYAFFMQLHVHTVHKRKKYNTHSRKQLQLQYILWINDRDIDTRRAVLIIYVGYIDISIHICSNLSRAL